jgi:hypothetical protein
MPYAAVDHVRIVAVDGLDAIVSVAGIHKIRAFACVDLIRASAGVHAIPAFAGFDVVVTVVGEDHVFAFLVALVNDQIVRAAPGVDTVVTAAGVDDVSDVGARDQVGSVVADEVQLHGFAPAGEVPEGDRGRINARSTVNYVVQRIVRGREGADLQVVVTIAALNTHACSHLGVKGVISRSPGKDFRLAPYECRVVPKAPK